MATYNAAANVGVYQVISGLPGSTGNVTSLRIVVDALPSGVAHVKCAIYEGASATLGSNPTTLLDYMTATVNATGDLLFDFTRGGTTRPPYSFNPALSALFAVNQDVAVGYSSGVALADYTIAQSYSSFPTSNPGSLVTIVPQTNLAATISVGDFTPAAPSHDCGTGSTDTSVEFYWYPNRTPQNYNLRYGPSGTDPGTWTMLTGIAGTACMGPSGFAGLCYTVSPVSPGSSWDWQVEAVYIGYTSPWSATQTCSATGSGNGGPPEGGTPTLSLLRQPMLHFIGVS